MSKWNQTLSALDYAADATPSTYGVTVRDGFSKLQRHFVIRWRERHVCILDRRSPRAAGDDRAGRMARSSYFERHRSNLLSMTNWRGHLNVLLSLLAGFVTKCLPHRTAPRLSKNYIEVLPHWQGLAISATQNAHNVWLDSESAP